MNIDLSVIIPAFNCDKYIRECVTSVLQNRTVNIECIVVNDGSTDKTSEILIDLQKEYKELIIINKLNGGVSSARNEGLLRASGKYITFVDGDDFIADFDFSFLKTDESDLICLDINRYHDGECEPVKFKDQGLVKNLINYPVYMNSVCNKLFKNCLVKEKKIHFDTTQWATEDLLFVIEYISNINISKISYIRGNYYSYRINKESATKKPLDQKTVLNNIRAYNKIKLILKEKYYRRYLTYLRIRMNFPLISNLHLFNPSLYRENTKCFDFWIYEWRIDKLLISILVRLHADFLIKRILMIKR